MVRLGSFLLSTSKRLTADVPFCDWLPIHVRGGAGGQGLPRYGGRGGDGGDVVVVATDECSCPQQDLSSVADSVVGRKLIAGAGESSRISALSGKRGADLLLKVPPGVVVKLNNGLEAGDLVKPGDKLVVARGGHGGKAETAFNGSAGDTTGLTLVLKLLADVAIVGFAGVGKSSLVAAMSTVLVPAASRAPPETTRPHVSTIKYSDGRQITVADLPPLLKRPGQSGGDTGASSNRFLRHSERASVILYVVDPSSSSREDEAALPMAAGAAPRAASSVVSAVLRLTKELERHRPALLDKRALLVLNKADLACHLAALDVVVKQQLSCLPELSAQLPLALRPRKMVEFDDVLCVSAKHDAPSIELLKSKLRTAVDRAADSDGRSVKLAEQLQRRLRDEVRGRSSRGSVALTDSYLI